MQPIIKRAKVQQAAGDPQPAPLPDLCAEVEQAEELLCEAAVVPKSARLVKIDGQVRAIELTCSCGEVSLLELDYTEDAPALPTENDS